VTLTANSPAEEEGIWKRLLTEAHRDAMGAMQGTLSPLPLQAMRFKFSVDKPVKGQRAYHCTYGVYAAVHKMHDIEEVLPSTEYVLNE
jgi:hypothetical protein